MLATLTFKSKKTSPEEDTDTRTMRQAYVVIKKQFGYTCTHSSPTCFPYLVRMQDLQAAMLNAPRWPMCMHCESPQLAAPKWQYSFTSLFLAERSTDECYKQINLATSMNSTLIFYPPIINSLSLCHVVFLSFFSPIPLADV